MDQRSVLEIYSTDAPIKRSSDRVFGLFFAALFGVLYYLHFRRSDFGYVIVGAAIILFLLALIRPTILAPLNKAWAKLGLLLSRITSPLFMSVIFFVVVTPIGFLMRLSKKDPLLLSLEPNAESYWKVRDVAGPPPDSMKRQF